MTEKQAYRLYKAYKVGTAAYKAYAQSRRMTTGELNAYFATIKNAPRTAT